ncbi:hypothetical protein RJT34_12371 [Clitoria ternatea]|uniref:Uncharacterized protein n=1 Tax=Clitoria ternatea TaxID=43366 RepID=A0AAN9PKE9_CLITE
MATQSKESTTLTQNKLPKTQSVTHVEESHKKAKLKRKFSAAVTLGDEGPSDKQKSPLKRKKKTAKFPSMSINEFLELNQEQNGDQMEDDEGDNGIGQQLEEDISRSEANEQANNGEIEDVKYAKNNEQPNQAEMFIETRQSTKGKPLDKDTQDAVATLQNEIQNSSESAIKAFQSLFGKEKSGRVRCMGRSITPTILKKNEEIAAIKKKHAGEISCLQAKVQGMEQEMDGLKTLVKCFLLQNNPGMDLESLAAKLGCSLGDASSAPNFSSHEEENDVEQED